MVVHAAEPPPVTADGVVLRFLGRDRHANLIQETGPEEPCRRTTST